MRVCGVGENTIHSNRCACFVYVLVGLFMYFNNSKVYNGFLILVPIRGDWISFEFTVQLSYIFKLYSIFVL